MLNYGFEGRVVAIRKQTTHRSRNLFSRTNILHLVETTILLPHKGPHGASVIDDGQDIRHNLRLLVLVVASQICRHE
jgi:hypothetical protein